jgi:rare lipoprotein A
MRLAISVIMLFLLPFRSDAQQRDSITHKTEGKASYYARKFDGRRTANGETFNNADYTAAHRTMPFNTYLNVVNKVNNLNVIVRVNDRGPYAHNRVIDLSESAARRIGGYHHGLVPVRIEVLNIIHLTPGLDSAFHAAPVVDCLGNTTELSGASLSLWSTNDLVHAIYVANDLYLKEPVDKVLIAHRHKASGKVYHVVITGIPAEDVTRVKDEYERKGFETVRVYQP